jgi:DNA helicase-2/ATP-dependent DNA helicase PcrA
MDFIITPQRQQYLDSRGKVIVNACPGSGKTTTVAYKLKNILDQWKSKYSGVACISFTNVAKDEINEKFYEFTGRSLSYPHLVSTIDSFINQYITLPHYHLLGYKTRPTILEDYSLLDSMFQYVLNKYKINNKPILYRYNPSKIDVAANESYLFDGKKTTLIGGDLEIFNKYCSNLKKMQYQRGLLKNSDSLYLALKILKENPKVAKQLNLRFRHLIIDEAQDTSEIQHLIIKELIANGLENVELIGDPYQSLYEWREARPDLFIDKTTSSDWNSLTMPECRRSVLPIVKAYSIFRMKEHDNLYSSQSDVSKNPLHLIYYNNLDNVISKYEEISSNHHNNIVLVRGKTLLQELKAMQVDIDYWSDKPVSPLHFIHAKSEMNHGQTKEAIRRIYRLVPVLFDPTLANDAIKKRDFLETNHDNYDLKSKIILLIKNLPGFDLTLTEWTHKLNELCERTLGLPHFSSFVLKQGQYRPIHIKKVEEVYQQPENLSKVTTIHKVKGKTFDSIMLVLSANSSGQNLSLNDFQRPLEMPNEKKRMLYVAMSRPQWQLVLAVPGQNRLTAEKELSLFGCNPTVHEV